MFSCGDFSCFTVTILLLSWCHLSDESPCGPNTSHFSPIPVEIWDIRPRAWTGKMYVYDYTVGARGKLGLGLYLTCKGARQFPRMCALTLGKHLDMEISQSVSSSTKDCDPSDLFNPSVLVCDSLWSLCCSACTSLSAEFLFWPRKASDSQYFASDARIWYTR